MTTGEISNFIKADVLERFLRYVQVWTTSDASATTCPSTARQLNLIRILEEECRSLGLSEVFVDERGFLYATLPSNASTAKEGFGLLAHVDTSPDQPGDDVRPQLHHNYDGSPIRFPDDPALTLTQQDCEELSHFIGDTIVTASGLTLLGADDKAGVAEIMAAMAAFQRFPSLPHGPIQICFTHDEEIGRGIDGIDLTRLPRFCYTMDGGFPGELEDECFDAIGGSLSFKGNGVHPGYAKGKMINAATIAARFVSSLPAAETPECTDGREGFFHITEITGDHENAKVSFILRDFESARNTRRVELLRSLKSHFEISFPGIQIELTTKQQYKNMREFLSPHPFVVERAHRAIVSVGLHVIRRPIRGGTDGSRLSELGHPTPNIFAGGLLFHSRREWVAHSALTKGAESIVALAREWSSPV